MAEFDPTIKPELTPERIAEAAATVMALSTEIRAGERDMMPYEVFKGWAHGNALPTLELGLVTPSETTDGSVNVYMLRRPPTEPEEKWRDKLHIPGVISKWADYADLTDEEDPSPIVERVLGETEGGITMLAKPLVYSVARRIGSRGPDLTSRLVVPVEGIPVKGDFYDVTTMLQPPNNQQLLETHDRAIMSVQKAAHRFNVLPNLRPYDQVRPQA